MNIPKYSKLFVQTVRETSVTRRIFAHDGSKRRGLAPGCAFSGFVDTALHLGGQILQNPNFGGPNRRSPAKLAKSKNMHIIKTTSSIPTKFCTVIKTTKCPTWVVQTRSSQIQDGGRPPSWKNRKIAISHQLFDWSPRNLAWSPVLSLPTPKISTFWKSKMAAAAILKNRKIAKSQQRLDRSPWFCVVTHFCPSWPFRPLKIRNFKIQDGGGRCH